MSFLSSHRPTPGRFGFNSVEEYDSAMQKWSDVGPSDGFHEREKYNDIEPIGGEGDGARVVDVGEGDGAPLANDGEVDEVPLDTDGEGDGAPLATDGEGDEVPSATVGEGDEVPLVTVGEGDEVPLVTVGEGDEVPLATDVEGDGALLATDVEGDGVQVAILQSDGEGYEEQTMRSNPIMDFFKRIFDDEPSMKVALFYSKWCMYCTDFKRNVWDEVMRDGMKDSKVFEVCTDDVDKEEFLKCTKPADASAIMNCNAWGKLRDGSIGPTGRDFINLGTPTVLFVRNGKAFAFVGDIDKNMFHTMVVKTAFEQV